MANRPVLRRRGVTAAAPAPEPVKAKKASKPIVEEEEIDEEEIVEEDEVDEEDEPEEEEEPAPVIRHKVAAAPVKAPAPAPVSKKAVVAPPPAKVVAKAAPKPVVEDDEEDATVEKKIIKVKPVDVAMAGDIVLNLLTAMDEGKSIIVTRNSDDKWTFGNADGKTASKGLVGRAYWDEVIDPAYWAWETEWSLLTQDERIKKAKKAGVTWTEDKDPRVNIMRASLAYREQIGIEKYKEQYRTRAQRAAIKG